jgi:hypothetical protein
MSNKHHKEIHEQLHRALDELVADFITHTGRRPSQATVLELIQWSSSQTVNPIVIPGAAWPFPVNDHQDHPAGD